jgi:hypothetical protein
LSGGRRARGPLGAQHLHRLRHRLGGNTLPTKLLLLSDASLLGLLLQLALALQLGLPLSLCLPLSLANAGDLGPALFGKPFIGSAKVIAPLLLGQDVVGGHLLR